MLTDVPEKAAESAAAVKALGDEVRSSTGGAASASHELGKQLDTVNDRTERVASGGAKKLRKAYEDLYESGGRLRESVSSLGESIHYRLMYPMQQLSWVFEGAAVGIVAFGLTTESSLQQANLAMTSFTGSASVAASTVAQLRQLQGAVPLGGLESAYQSLGQAGMGNSQIMATLRGLTGISDVSLNPANSMSSMAQAIASMQSTGLMTASDVNAFSGAGVNIWGMLARETGQTPSELRMRFLRAGTPMAMPSSFLGDLMSTGQATGGSAAYQKTWAGQMEQTKKAFGDLLAVFETPLGNALSGAGAKVDTWAQATESRFTQMGGKIGRDWSSGNMSGLGAALADVVGDPKLSGDIATMATALHGLSNIVTRSVIPMGHELVTVANPALHAFADILDFLGQHRALTEGLITTLGGFIVFSKVAQWGSNAVTMFRAFSDIMESRGVITAISAYSRGLEGLAQAQQTVAATGAEEALSERVAGSGLSGALGKLGVAGVGAGLAYSGMTSRLGWGSALSTVGGDAAMGAMAGSVIPGLGTLAGGILGGGIGAATDLFRLGQSQSQAHHTSIGTVRQINITVPGAGNPNKVANSIPKAINAQVQAYNARTSRRGGS